MIQQQRYGGFLTAAAAVSVGVFVLHRLWQRRNIAGADPHRMCDHGPDDETCICIGNNRAHCIYLDYNGTTSIHPDVVEAMMPYFTTHYGNPSSSHMMSRQPRWAINRARASILHLLGVLPPHETLDIAEEVLSSIIFTSCGTESDNLAVHLALSSCRNKLGDKKPHMVTCNIEHPAITACLQKLVDRGQIDVTWVPVGTDGRVSASDMIDSIRSDNSTVLVTLMLANNEVGSLQPVAEVARACRERNVLFHTDAAQAVGKVSVELSDLGHPDMISIVGHKIGAPKGVAVLYVRPKCLQEHGRTVPGGNNAGSNNGIMVTGGNQEYGFRGGTENVPYIIGMGKAVDIVRENWTTYAKHMEAMRTRLLEGLRVKVHPDWILVNGPSEPTQRLPNTLSIGFKTVNAAMICKDLYEKVAMSTGATCHSSDDGSISSVLTNMKVPESFGRGTFRLSLGPMITENEIDKATVFIARAVNFYISENDATYCVV